MLLIGLGSARVLTFHEVVFAEPAREMLATGDWIIPRIAGQPFTDKPPMMAWSIAGFMWLFASDSEWVVRLSSVAACLASGVLIGWLAARWFGRFCGLVAGCMQLTTVHVLMQGRLAESDTLLAAGMAGAMTIFAVAHVGPLDARWQSRWSPALFYGLTAWCVLVKGLVGPAFIFSGCLAYLYLDRNLGRASPGRRFLLDPIGLAVGVAIGLPWLVIACWKCPGLFEQMVIHHFGRFQGELGVHEPRLAYLYQVPMMMLPWTLFAGWGLWHLRGTLRSDPRWRFLACWFVPGMLLLCWSTYKSKHYPIPLLPPITILAAAGLVHYLRWRYTTARPMRLLLALLVAGGCGLTAYILVARGAKNAAEICALLAIMAVGSLVMLFCEHRRLVAGQIAGMFATVWLVSVAVQALIMPSHDSYRHQAELARAINQVVPAGEPLYMLRLPESQLTYYLQTPIVRLDCRAEFPAHVAGQLDSSLYILAPRFVAEKLALLGEVREIFRASRINRYMTERDRLVFLRWKSAAHAASTLPPWEAPGGKCGSLVSHVPPAIESAAQSAGRSTIRQ